MNRNVIDRMAGSPFESIPAHHTPVRGRGSTHARFTSRAVQSSTHAAELKLVTHADRLLQDRVRALLVAGTVPEIAHYVAPNE